jgi:mRNA-degrading endonuclease RelE of RelBE toxin-antitoxin system
MIREVERVRKTEHRTRSELIREALRAYFNARQTFPGYTPTAAELRAIEKGRAAIRRDQHYTLDEFRTWLLGATGKKARAKKRPARASAWAGATARALDEMARDPFTGDIVQENQATAFCRRVGDWRIFFHVCPEQHIIEVSDIQRRTTTTYRQRWADDIRGDADVALSCGGSDRRS